MSGLLKKIGNRRLGGDGVRVRLAGGDGLEESMMLVDIDPSGSLPSATAITGDVEDGRAVNARE